MKAPAGLGARGRRLWRETTAAMELTAGHLVLLEEACRIADRLDRLDAVIRSGSVESEDIRPLLAEGRQHSAALKQLLAELHKGQAVSGPAAAESSGGAGVSDLTKRIADRRRQAES